MKMGGKRKILLKMAVLGLATIICANADARSRGRGGTRGRGGNDAFVQGLGGLVGGLTSAAQRQQAENQRQQAAEQRRLQREEENRARQLEVQRRRAEADAAKAEAQRIETMRLQRLAEEQRMQRQLADDRRRQIEMEKQKLALDRQRWKEEADHEGWFVFGVHIPSWLWQAGVVGILGWILSLIFRRGR